MQSDYPTGANRNSPDVPLPSLTQSDLASGKAALLPLCLDEGELLVGLVATPQQL